MVKEFPDVIIAALPGTSFILTSNANALYRIMEYPYWIKFIHYDLPILKQPAVIT